MDRNTKKGIDGNWRKETTVSPGWQKKYVVCPWMLWRFLFNQVPPFTAGPHLYNPSFSQELNDHLGLIWWAGWRRESNSCRHHQDNTLSLSSSVRELDSTYDHPLDIAHDRWDEDSAPKTLVINFAEGDSITLFSIPTTEVR